MIKNISMRWLNDHGACGRAKEQFKTVKNHELFATFKRLIRKEQYDWCMWLLYELIRHNNYNLYSQFRYDWFYKNKRDRKKLCLKYIDILKNRKVKKK